MPNCKNRTAFQFSQGPDLQRNMPVLFSTSSSQPFVKKKKDKKCKARQFKSVRIEVFCSLFCINKSCSHRSKGGMVEKRLAGKLATEFLKDWFQDQC